jgi:small neutral amino acid transporter SnatA (MarC family)
METWPAAVGLAETWPGLISALMNGKLERPAAKGLVLLVTAIVVALSLAHIAHCDLGLSRPVIRTVGLSGASIVAMLMGIKYFGEKLDNSE